MMMHGHGPAFRWFYILGRVGVRLLLSHKVRAVARVPCLIVCFVISASHHMRPLRRRPLSAPKSTRVRRARAMMTNLQLWRWRLALELLGPSTCEPCFAVFLTCDISTNVRKRFLRLSYEPHLTSALGSFL